MRPPSDKTTERRPAQGGVAGATEKLAIVVSPGRTTMRRLGACKPDVETMETEWAPASSFPTNGLRPRGTPSIRTRPEAPSTSIRTNPAESLVAGGAEARDWLAEGGASVAASKEDDGVPEGELWGSEGPGVDVLGAAEDGREVSPPAVVTTLGEVDFELDALEGLVALRDALPEDPALDEGENAEAAEP